MCIHILNARILIEKLNCFFQRRRSSEDEKMMRKYLQEGDLISAEVMNVFQDGALSLHTRSLKYGKVKVFKYLGARF